MVGYLVSLAIFTATYALFSLGLNLQWGYTGLINFGHIAFMTVGAYTTVLLSLNGVPLVLAVLAGAILAGILGLLIGISTLRLREDYLAIVTIGVSEVVRLIALNEEELTQGTRGVYGFPLPLASLNPNLPLRLGMIVILTMICGVGVWQIWRWLGHVPQGADRSVPLRRAALGRQRLALGGYLLCLGGSVTALWWGFAMNTGFLGLAGASAIAALGCVYSRFSHPLKTASHQSWLTHSTIIAVNLVLGLVLMVYWAGVMGLYDYTYKAGLMWLLVVILGFTFWQLQRWVHSPWGRVLKSIREDEEVAKALGKNVFRYKLQSLMLGGAIAGIAGAFYAWQLTFINPDGFIPLITFQAWIIVVLGGAGNNVGTLLGAMIFWVYDAATRFLLPSLVTLDDARLGAFRIMVIGLLLIVLMMWRPQGILGNKDELTLGR
ncbi:branched-chain amino acid ABC transporter permease [Synechococcales cyanobacterium C]|uniref:Branched-chain amino acid ABC transporter permease n=1 Tax=Petrachloros mirabilis ULC683 TaxID=2781853 RepID=A0A8K2A044_9CYAN|nr:branched-chain amino acid ABC transporter permease [Petrachloros mirabilis]NCJ06992.1 branched-chain amino acid ABC transporter permease [Petrachloros mirabilis ULC683]